MTDSMSSPKIVIVGAGIAGLCAGVYARKSGFEAEIVEMASSSGGLATSWKRQQYTFETCLHWLLGSNPASPAHSLWQEVFDIGELKFVDLENFAQIESSQGQSITLSRNLDLLEKELRRVSPKDTKIIQRLVRGMRKLSKGEIPLATNGIFDVLVQGVRMVPYLPEIRHWSRMSVEELGAQFEHPLLKRFFSGDREQKQLSALALVLSFAWMSKKDAGYPIGGSQAIIRLIEKKFRELGGTIRFNSSVDRILVENDRNWSAVIS